MTDLSASWMDTHADSIWKGLENVSNAGIQSKDSYTANTFKAYSECDWCNPEMKYYLFQHYLIHVVIAKKTGTGMRAIWLFSISPKMNEHDMDWNDKCLKKNSKHLKAQQQRGSSRLLEMSFEEWMTFETSIVSEVVFCFTLQIHIVNIVIVIGWYNLTYDSSIALHMLYYNCVMHTAFHGLRTVTQPNDTKHTWSCRLSH